MWDFKFTPIPNAVGDQYLTTIGPAAFTVLYALARNTLGWHRIESDMSLRQIAEYTGLSVNTIRTAISVLVDNGLIEQTFNGTFTTPARYAIVTEPTPIDSVSKFDTVSVIDTQGVSKIDTGSVSKIDTSKRKKKIVVERKKNTAAAAAYLKQFGIDYNNKTAPIAGMDAEYIQAHLDNARRKGKDTGYAIHCMNAGDPIPVDPNERRNEIPAEYADVVMR